MKTFQAYVILATVMLAAAYDDLDDTLDFEAMLNTPADLRTLLDCYLDTKPCPPKFLPYRRHAEEAVDDACRECSTLQKHNVRLILKELKQLFPEDFAKLAPKYDNDGKNTHFNTLLNEVGKF